MKYQKGQKVTYRGQQWTVCEGGHTDSKRKVYRYKLARGAWKRLIAGDCITA